MEEVDSITRLPLLSPRAEFDGDQTPRFLLGRSSVYSFASYASLFVPDADDIAPIKGCRDFFKEFMAESRKLWTLAGPAIFTSICQYSLGAVTQTFAGHLGSLELAAFSVENSIIANFCFGILVINFLSACFRCLSRIKS